MDLLNHFIQYLSSGKENASHATVKNYKADVKKFIAWVESEFKKPFSPSLVSKEIIHLYRPPLSSRSLERYHSSLRKFFRFLNQEGYLSQNPFDSPQQAQIDPYKLKTFKDFLYESNLSGISIKNYIIDVRQFFQWAQNVTGVNEAWYVGDKNIFSKINHRLLSEYRQRLLSHSQFSASSINRKLSSLKKYVSWAVSQGLIASVSFSPFTHTRAHVRSVQKTDVAYHPFPPIRLAQKVRSAAGFVLDRILIHQLAKGVDEFEYQIGRIKKDPIFIREQPVTHAFSHLPKAFYQPTSLSITYYSPFRKVLHHLRHTRPKWYKRYHENPVTHYLHFSILILAVSFAGATLAQALQIPSNQNVLGSSAVSPSRTLSFQGRLTDPNGNAISLEKQVRFALYDSPTTASASALLWEETDIIEPDTSGFFATILGDFNTIPQSLFAENPDVWLGVTIGEDPELVPRQQLATVPYATNAELLAGLPPITAQAGTKNVILALDSSGNLTIGGSASPVFQATGGELKLSGKTLVLSTNAGTNGNVSLAPDGTGIIDVQKAIQNSTSANTGAVKIADRLTITASDSTTATLIVNNNTSSGNIFVASSSGTTKLVLTNDGSLGLGTTSPNAKLTVAGTITPNGNNESDIGSSTKAWKNIYAYGVLPGTTTGTQGWWQRNSGSIAPTNISDDFLIGGIATSSATLRIASSGTITTAGSFTFSSNGTIQTSSTSNTLTIGGSNTGNIFFLPNNSAGKVGINTSSPLANLDIRASANDAPVASFSGSTGLATLIVDNSGVGDIFTASSSGLNRFVVRQQGQVGVGTSLPSLQLHVSDSQAATASAMIENTNTGIDADGLVVKLGYTGTGTATNNFVTFLNGNGLIHGKINSTGSSGVAYTTSGIDFAEYFKKEDDSELFEQGDLLCLGESGGVTKCDKSTKRTSMVGVVSLYPGFIGGINRENNPSYVLVGLVGQVPIKVEGSVAPGDFLAPSFTPGAAQKAREAGMIAGKVLSYTPSSNTAVLLLSPSWYDPLVFLTDSGDLNITIGSKNYKEDHLPRTPWVRGLRFGEFMEQLAIQAFYAINATIESLDAIKITASSLVVSDTLISPIAYVDRLHTNVISPLSQSPSLEIGISNQAVEIRSKENDAASFSAVARIDTRGNATFSGELAAHSLAAQNASIAGILKVRDLIAEENLKIASYSGDLATIDTLNTRFARFSEGIIALGPSSLTDVSVGGLFSVGSQSNSLILADNSINVLNSTLEIQPLRQGAVNVMGGLVSIDTQGNLTVNGTLSASVLAPIPNSDLVVRLGPKTQGFDPDLIGVDPSFIIQNRQEQLVFSVNHLGDVIASGSGSFTKLILNSSIANALSETEIESSGSAGVATISAQKTEITVKNTLITNNSLIYITPKTDTQTALFLLRQRDGESFTVGIQNPLPKDIPFNWLIIN